MFGSCMPHVYFSNMPPSSPRFSCVLTQQVQASPDTAPAVRIPSPLSLLNTQSVEQQVDVSQLPCSNMHISQKEH